MDDAAVQGVVLQIAGHLLYLCPKLRPGGPSALVRTPLELIGKIAALLPPPRTHRHR